MAVKTLSCLTSDDDRGHGHRRGHDGGGRENVQTALQYLRTPLLKACLTLWCEGSPSA
jgi:hypothetical protein